MYGAKAMPSLVTVPAQNFILIRGKGNPNDAAFSDRVAALYAVAYAIKMGYKAAAVRNAAAEAMHDFAVYPLEGVWSQKAEGGLVKDMLEYAMSLRLWKKWRALRRSRACGSTGAAIGKSI